MSELKRPRDYKGLGLGPDGEDGFEEWAKEVRGYLVSVSHDEAVDFARLLLRQLRDTQISNRLELVLGAHKLTPHGVSKKTQRVELLQVVAKDLEEFIQDSVAEEREKRDRHFAQLQDAREQKRFITGLIVDVTAVAISLVALFVAIASIRR